MKLPRLDSIKNVDKIYNTGEKPVLVLCSDMNYYVCKYRVSSSPSYKLTCELIGSILAKVWKLNVSDFALISIKKEHWDNIKLSHSYNSISIGSSLQLGVLDINNTTYNQVDSIKDNLIQLLKIALFDFWIANEDRNYNNTNLMYDIIQNKLIPIDFGCIFNTATFDYPMSPLTETDTILKAPIFKHLIKKMILNLEELFSEINIFYQDCINNSEKSRDFIVSSIPPDWNVSSELIINKINQLFCKEWVESTWNNFQMSVVDNLQINKI